MSNLKYTSKSVQEYLDVFSILHSHNRWQTAYLWLAAYYTSKKWSMYDHSLLLIMYLHFIVEWNTFIHKKTTKNSQKSENEMQGGRMQGQENGVGHDSCRECVSWYTM
jgi:hypothetical protein